jgi:hypothetical protein
MRPKIEVMTTTSEGSRMRFLPRAPRQVTIMFRGRGMATRTSAEHPRPLTPTSPLRRAGGPPRLEGRNIYVYPS